jgi:hypothetical protein
VYHQECRQKKEIFNRLQKIAAIFDIRLSKSHFLEIQTCLAAWQVLQSWVLANFIHFPMGFTHG